MSVSLDCEVTIEPLGDWEEIDEEKLKTMDSAERAFREMDVYLQLCKSHDHKIHKVKQPKSSFFSIITGVALIALGVVLEPVSGGTSTVIIGLGASLIGSAVYDEIKEACEDDKPKYPAPPQNTTYKPVPYEGVKV